MCRLKKCLLESAKVWSSFMIQKHLGLQIQLRYNKNFNADVDIVGKMLTIKFNADKYSLTSTTLTQRYVIALPILRDLLVILLLV